MRRLHLPKTAALLAEAIAVDVETPEGEQATVDLRGLLLGTDADATRLFAVAARRARTIAPERIARARGVRARAVRHEWQGEPVDTWIEVRAQAPGRAQYLGTARRIFYRSDKKDGRRRTHVHDFGRPAPALYRAGPHFFLLGGKKRVTARGIEG